MPKISSAMQLSPRLAEIVREGEKAGKSLRTTGSGQQKCDVRGKFIFLAGRKFYIKSVSASSADECFEPLSRTAINTVWLSNPTSERVQYLNELGMKVVARFDLDSCLQRLFSGDKSAFKNWLTELSAQVEMLKLQPSVIAYDISALFAESISRFLGAKKILGYVRRAFEVIKKHDSQRPVTCSLDSRFLQLDLPFLDFLSYQVCVGSLADFRIELAQLQMKAADKPLIVHSSSAEMACSNEEDQARTISDEIHMAFYAGCAGFSFSKLQDSAKQNCSFSLLNENGKRKPAFEATNSAFNNCPFPPYFSYPKISVVICAYNGEEWIEECLDGCSRLDYPNYEVILINDGSTDHTLGLAEPKAKKYGFKIVNQVPNAGLSAARNLGMQTASGEIIAYLDQDAFPDEHWLRYLAITFLSTQAAVVGGPNINPLSCGPRVDCIDQAPGNSQIVMVEDEMADHIPGCNLAVRRAFMQSIGGFDERYRFGGDDVNFCWKVVRAGGRLAPSPGAMVWHYRRKTIDAYLRQQKGYGKGEAALEKDWPERFNSLGHQVCRRKADNAPGTAGSQSSAQFQLSGSAVYQAMNGGHSFFKMWLLLGPSMPEWPILLSIFAVLSLLGLVCPPYLLFAPFLLCGLSMWFAQAICAGFKAQLRFPSLKSQLIVSYLHIAQPIARMNGRLQAGMTPWRSRCHAGFKFPSDAITRFELDGGMNERASAELFERAIKRHRLPATPGSAETNWDWQIDGGIFGGIQLLLDIDDSAKQLVMRSTPFIGGVAKFMLGVLALSLLLAISAHSSMLALLSVASIIALVAACVLHSGEANAALEPLLSEALFKRNSLWERFSPPRHYFVEPVNCLSVVRCNEVANCREDGRGTPGLPFNANHCLDSIPDDIRKPSNGHAWRAPTLSRANNYVNGGSNEIR